MPLCGGSAKVMDEHEIELRRRNKEKEKLLAQSQKEEEDCTHLLLLGAGESGKSTVFKQMKVLNQGGYSEAELKAFRPIIHRNVLDGIQILLRECDARGLELDEANEERGDQLMVWQGENLNPQLAAQVSVVWKDPAVQACYQARDQFQFPTAAKFFLDHATRMGANDYLPSVTDVVSRHTRPAAHACIDADPIPCVPSRSSMLACAQPAWYRSSSSSIVSSSPCTTLAGSEWSAANG